MPADLFICAGEASGDLQASLLVGALKRIRPGLRVRAVGGDRLRAAGAEVVLDPLADGWASIGHLNAYVKIPRLLAVMLRLAESLLRDPPALLACVDFGAFNLRMLEWLRFRGYRGRAVYYFPPGAWLDREQQARKVARVSEALTPFEHQAAFYRGLGLPIAYFGHPLTSVIAPRPATALGDPPRVAVMPGSRVEEVSRHLPVLAAAARTLAATRPIRFSVVAASDELARTIASSWPTESGGAQAVKREDAVPVLSGADAAWVASGTAVLETALRGVPQVTFYRLSDVQYRMVERRLPWLITGFITLPNLVLGSEIVRELKQGGFTPDALIAATTPLLEDGPQRRAMLSAYERLRAALGPPDALERIAAHVDALLAAVAS